MGVLGELLLARSGLAKDGEQHLGTVAVRKHAHRHVDLGARLDRDEVIEDAELVALDESYLDRRAQARGPLGKILRIGNEIVDVERIALDRHAYGEARLGLQAARCSCERSAGARSLFAGPLITLP